MIKFKTIRWKNLLSTGNSFTEISLDTTKTTLIVGKNGSGKSTLLDAITFVLFNKPFRKVNKGQLINSIVGKNLLVEIAFEKGGSQWLVRRGSKPNVFEIHKNGVLVDQNSENRDYQGYLETVLGMNQKAFSQVVILGAASFIPFMQLTVPARREVIEDLLDIQVFSDMNVLLKGRVSANKVALAAAEHAMMMAKTKISMAEEFNETQKSNKKGQIDLKKNKVAAVTQSALEVIVKLDAEITKMELIEIDNKQVDTLNEQKRMLEDDLLVLQQQIRNSEKQLALFSKFDTCPTCQQDISWELKEHEMSCHENDIKIRNENTQRLKIQLEEISKHLTEISEVNKTVKKHQALIVEYNREIQWYQKQVEDLTAEIEEMEKENTKALTDLAPLKKELKEKTSALEARKEHTKVLDAAAILLKDGGIKSVIIKQYIPIINSLINKYLATMDFFVDFQINETFEETIKSRFRDEFSYESFSEGEKQRIDLAVLFAWRAVAKMRNSASTNLLIFDEILDSSLDSDGQGNFTKILENMVDQENIFIISHNVAIGDSFDNVLRFDKVRGYSIMENQSGNGIHHSK